jgi:protein TonB
MRSFLKIVLAISVCIISTTLFAQTNKIEKKPVPHKTEVEGEVFEIFDVSQKALFPGGEDSLQQFIATHITYPPLAITSGTQGTVNVVFIVDNNGNVKDVAILGKPKGDGLDEAAINVIKLTSGMWTPAKIRDRSVNMRFRIPIAFRL